MVATELLKISVTGQPSIALKQALQPAVTLLTRGECVAMPTETVYGLAANALQPGAVQKIFTAKGRPSDNPLIVHVSSKEMLMSIVSSIPPVYEALMAQFWPGPLTLLFPKVHSKSYFSQPFLLILFEINEIQRNDKNKKDDR